MKDAEKWKERLAQARDWLKKLSSSPKDAVALEEEIRQAGYAKVIARHLIEGAPSFDRQSANRHFVHVLGH